MLCRNSMFMNLKMVASKPPPSPTPAGNWYLFQLPVAFFVPLCYCLSIWRWFSIFLLLFGLAERPNVELRQSRRRVRELGAIVVQEVLGGHRSQGSEAGLGHARRSGLRHHQVAPLGLFRFRLRLGRFGSGHQWLRLSEGAVKLGTLLSCLSLGNFAFVLHW